MTLIIYCPVKDKSMETERSPGEGNGTPLLYSCLENPMDRGAWQATIHGVKRIGQDWSDLAATHIATVKWLETAQRVRTEKKGEKRDLQSSKTALYYIAMEHLKT